MKKLLFTTALVALVGVASAQTDQGSFVFGADSNLSFVSSSIDGQDDNVNEFSLDVVAGYFLMDNLAAGLLVGFENASQGDYSESATIVGPWARYYVGGTFFLGAAYGAVSSTVDDGESEFDVSGGLLSFEAGYPIFLGDNAAIEPSLNYTTFSGDFDGQSSFGLEVGFNLYF